MKLPHYLFMSDTSFTFFVNVELADDWAHNYYREVGLWQFIEEKIDKILNEEKVEGMIVYLRKKAYIVYDGSDFVDIIKQKFGTDFEDEIKREYGLEESYRRISLRRKIRR